MCGRLTRTFSMQEGTRRSVTVTDSTDINNYLGSPIMFKPSSCVTDYKLNLNMKELLLNLVFKTDYITL